MGGEFIAGTIPERFVEVDAARLLLLLVAFAEPSGDAAPLHGARVSGHFTPEYRLQKLDFLLRNPAYFAYELVTLHRQGADSARNPTEIKTLVRKLFRDREPELRTLPFRKFWRGAYERLDDVEAWWWSRRLVYCELENRGDAPPQKHYYHTEQASLEAQRLIRDVEQVGWYWGRIQLLKQYFGSMTATELKGMQYQHAEYRQAQIMEYIPDLSLDEIGTHFQTVFHEPLEVRIG